MTVPTHTHSLLFSVLSFLSKLKHFIFQTFFSLSKSFLAYFHFITLGFTFYLWLFLSRLCPRSSLDQITSHVSQGCWRCLSFLGVSHPRWYLAIPDFTFNSQVFTLFLVPWEAQTWLLAFLTFFIRVSLKSQIPPASSDMLYTFLWFYLECGLWREKNYLTGIWMQALKVANNVRNLGGSSSHISNVCACVCARMCVSIHVPWHKCGN